MMLDDFFVEWYLSKTILEEMAAARSRFMHFHVDQNHFFHANLDFSIEK